MLRDIAEELICPFMSTATGTRKCITRRCMAWEKLTDLEKGVSRGFCTRLGLPREPIVLEISAPVLDDKTIILDDDAPTLKEN